MNRLPWRAWVAGLVGFAIAFAFSHGRSSPYNNYVCFADALLHGRIWIDWPGPSIDAVLFEGHRYIVNDPLPAILLLPVVGVWHLAANQTPWRACSPESRRAAPGSWPAISAQANRMPVG